MPAPAAPPPAAAEPDILLGWNVPRSPTSPPPPAPALPQQPLQGQQERRERQEDTPPQQRSWRADVDGHDVGESFEVGRTYRMELQVSPNVTGAAAATPFVGDIDILESDLEATQFELTVQVSSEDFRVSGATSQPLLLPREGPSSLAGFDIVSLHPGDCALTGTVHLDGNFICQLEVTMPVADSARTTLTMTSVGRPPESAVTLEPRDVSLILVPAPEGGFSCTLVGPVTASVRLPISREELAMATDAVQKAMLDVVLSVDEQGRKPFTSGISIPEPQVDKALHNLSRSGGRLFQQLFQHPGAGADLARMGEWLRQQAADPTVQLTVQVVAHDAPIPWALLYLGDLGPRAVLSWDHFLGMRHVIEQIPFQMSLSVPDQRIVSTPSLSVGLNVNRDIDQQFGVTMIADHVQHWADLRAHRRTLDLAPRSTRASVVAALADPATENQVQYFYCHATSAGVDGNPDGAMLQMSLTDTMTLADLNVDAPREVQLVSHPLVFVNACESADLSPLFYAGFVPYFMAKGARGVIGTECRTPALFAVKFAEAFFDRLLDGQSVGDSLHGARRSFLTEHRNPLGLLYALHCDADTRVDPALT